MATELKEPQATITFIAVVIILSVLGFCGFYRQGKLVNDKIHLIRPYMSITEARSILGDPLGVFKDETDPDKIIWKYYSADAPGNLPISSKQGNESLVLFFKNGALVAYSYNYSPDFMARLKGKKPMVKTWRSR